MLLSYNKKCELHFTGRETYWPVLNFVPFEPYLTEPCAFLTKPVKIRTYPFGTWVLSQISQTSIELGLKRGWLFPVPLVNNITPAVV